MSDLDKPTRSALAAGELTRLRARIAELEAEVAELQRLQLGYRMALADQRKGLDTLTALLAEWVGYFESGCPPGPGADGLFASTMLALDTAALGAER